MMTFDRVVPELLRICEESAATSTAIERFCVVRDVRGRVRLAVQPAGNVTVDASDLEAALVQALDAFFVGPVLLASGGTELARLAQQLLEQSDGRWPAGWPRSYQNVLGGGDQPIDAGGRWTGIERTVGKEAWLSAPSAEPPWPLVRGKTPPIVTFHSFKGGVGRTTLVAAYACRLASAVDPRRVAVIDLDVEAPGLASLLGVTTRRGVLDVLVDHIATGRTDLTDVAAPAALEGDAGLRIAVFGAGRLDDVYVQKLARLDFSSTEPGRANPVGEALADMLKAIKKDYDIVLLDSRAGLHDLAGMSLHGFAHVDVLVFRGTEQGFAGLGQTLRTLGQRDAVRLVLVENLMPTDKETRASREQRTRSRVYELLLEHIYPEEEPPQASETGEPHDVVFVDRESWLDGLDSIQGRVDDLSEHFRTVGERIDAACVLAAEAGEEDEE